VKYLPLFHHFKAIYNQNQKQVILQLQRDLSDKDRNIDNLIAQVNELIEDKISVETFSYLPSVRQVVQPVSDTF
jgi:hypothetical protein